MPPNWSVSFREKPQSLSLTQAPTSSLPSPTTHSPSPSSPTGLFALLGHTKLRAFFAHAGSSPSFLFPQIIRMALSNCLTSFNLCLNPNISEMLSLTPCLNTGLHPSASSPIHINQHHLTYVSFWLSPLKWKFHEVRDCLC